MNITFLSSHLDEPETLLSQLGHDFSFISNTETKFQTKVPPINCDLSGYTPTEAEKGGALLYVQDCLQFTERLDLDSGAHKCWEVESKFIEIIMARNNCWICLPTSFDACGWI